MSSLPNSYFYTNPTKGRVNEAADSATSPSGCVNGSVTDLALTQDDAYIWTTLMSKWEEKTFKATLVSSLLSLCVSIYEQLRRQQSALMTPPSSPLTRESSLEKLTGFMSSALKRSRLTTSCLVLTVFYMALLSTPRSLSPEEEAAIHKLSSHSCLEIFLACLLAAHKYTEDVAYYNSSWGDLAGIPLATVNCLEKTLLCGLGHQLVVSRVQFKRWVAKLARKLHWVDPVPIFAPRPLVTAPLLDNRERDSAAQK